jgi:predicted extracellular nuclease
LRPRMLALCLAAVAVLGGGTSALAAADDAIVISEFRTRGPAGGNDEFVELRNRSGASVDISGWLLQGCASGSPGNASNRATVGAGIVLSPGQSYLFANNGASGYSGSVEPDQTYGTGITDFAATNFAGIRLVDAGGNVRDGVGSPNSPCREGTGILTPAANGDNSFERSGGTADSGNNAADFQGPKGGDPQKFGPTGGDAAPSVTSKTPANGAVEVANDANVTITFSEDVTVSAAWYAIGCTRSGAHTASVSGGPRTYQVDPDANFTANETCTVTVKAAGVADGDSDDPPDNMAADHTFSFSTAGIPATIMQIQGAGHVSPLAGQRVSGVPGIVTAIRPTSFYMQDAAGDGDLATSDGILVFGVSTSSLTVGGAVRVNARVNEFRPGGGDNLTLTELDQATVTTAGPGTPIVPTVLGAGGRTQPSVVIEDDASGDLSAPGQGGNTFDPAADGIDFYESLEGMLLQVNNAAVVNATRSFGEITLLADAGANATGLRTARGGILLAANDANPERMTVDDEILRDQISPRPAKAMPDLNVGARITSPVVGPLDYSFENYKIQALTQPLFVESPIEREVAAVAHPSDLTVATFNVENLAVNNPQSKFDELAGMIVHNLRSPAIVAIEEIQDDNGATDNGNVSAVATWAKLLAAIDAAGGPGYDYRQIDPVNNADGGAPGANIRVGLLFRTDLPELAFVDRPGGTSTNNTSVVGTKNHPRLTFSPGRLGAGSVPFIATRKPLAGEFVWKGRTVFVVANHFSSKGEDQGIFSRWQPPTNASEGPRHGQAQIVNTFVDDVLAVDKDANVIALGDINDFEFSRTIEILEGNELTTLMKILPPTERYSYVFEGNSQVLDQILVSDSIFSRSPAYDVVHVNAEFADARQASDHEPQVAYLRPKGTGGTE